LRDDKVCEDVGVACIRNNRGCSNESKEEDAVKDCHCILSVSKRRTKDDVLQKRNMRILYEVVVIVDKCGLQGLGVYKRNPRLFHKKRYWN